MLSTATWQLQIGAGVFALGIHGFGRFERSAGLSNCSCIRLHGGAFSHVQGVQGDWTPMEQIPWQPGTCQWEKAFSPLCHVHN